MEYISYAFVYCKVYISHHNVKKNLSEVGLGDVFGGLILKSSHLRKANKSRNQKKKLKEFINKIPSSTLAVKWTYNNASLI